MPRPGLVSPLTLALIGSLLSSGIARAQVPPPPPVVVVPAPQPYAPAPVMVPVYDPMHEQRRMHDFMLARVFTGVGTTALVLGFFSLMAGIPVLVLTSTHDLCKPSSTNSCDSYYALSYGLIGGGVASMVAGTALDIVGSVYRYRARYASIDLFGPRVALLPSSSGSVGGAAATLALRF
jgi:hypothetical protein